MTETTGFVSADSHVNEPRNLWRPNLPLVSDPEHRYRVMREVPGSRPPACPGASHPAPWASPKA